MQLPGRVVLIAALLAAINLAFVLSRSSSSGRGVGPRERELTDKVEQAYLLHLSNLAVPTVSLCRLLRATRQWQPTTAPRQCPRSHSLCRTQSGRG
jgi:hypothetical protein